MLHHWWATGARSRATTVQIEVLGLDGRADLRA